MIIPLQSTDLGRLSNIKDSREDVWISLEREIQEIWGWKGVDGDENRREETREGERTERKRVLGETTGTGVQSNLGGAMWKPSTMEIPCNLE